MPENSWKRIERKKIYSSQFLEVFADTVRLPNGKIIDDYTLVKKPDIVVIVATTSDGKLLTFSEYKYAADEMLNTLPAGHVENGELVLEAAKRELQEETGYTSDQFTLCGTLCEYPTKDLHKVYIVVATNVHLAIERSLEDTEIIEGVRFLNTAELQEEIKEGKWTITAILAALAVAGILKADH